jgi:hypothetical protein
MLYDYSCEGEIHAKTDRGFIPHTGGYLNAIKIGGLLSYDIGINPNISLKVTTFVIFLWRF